MKIPSIRKKAWLLLVMVLILAALASILLASPYRNEYQTTVEPLRFSGTYQLESEAAPQPLTGSTFIDACVNQSVTLRGTFDRTLEKDRQLLFFMEYLEVHLYFDGKEIYTWGTAAQHPSFMRSAGAAWGHCVLPATITPDDEITIVLQSKYTNNYNSAYHDFLDSFQTGDSGALARAVLGQNWQHLLLGGLLFLVGLTLLLFALLLVGQGIPIHPSIYYCAFFVLSCSLWTLLNPIYSTLVLANAPLIMLLETVSLWLFSIFLFGYFGTYMRTKAKQANNLLVFGYTFALAVFLVLQLFGVTDAYAVRDFYNILLAACVTGFMFIFGYEYRHGDKSDMRTLMPVSILYMVFGLIEVINYQFEWFQRGGALTVGLFLFITVQLFLAVRQIRDSLLLSMKAVTLEKDLAESRTAVMLSQIQPHFLYNALVGIKELCDSGEQQTTSKALEHFAYYLRGNMNSLSDKGLIPFAQEVSHVKDYLYLEKMRFEEKLGIVWELQFTHFQLPPLTLQPIVENAVRHGITEKKGGGTLTIRSEKSGDAIIITITDDGVGFDTEEPKDDGRSHIGIENVRKRLAAQCGGSLIIESERGTGTTAKIILPGTEVGNENLSGGR